MAILAAVSVESILNVVWVALGLGLVIFFHELGHFAVAKWCNVNVERFSIGFGPILWSHKRGETEYALSAIPFGGYVKMLGQDDIDPSQLSSDEIAQDPRSYSAKPVWQRMAIISAGVIMNIITGVLFFALAFVIGRDVNPPVVGAVEPGMPAWKAGLQRGDVITEIDGREVTSFLDITRSTALSRGDIQVEGTRRSGETFSTVVRPDFSGTRPKIGVEPALGLQLIRAKHQVDPVMEGTSAAEATPPFQPGDIIRKVAGEEIEDFPHLQDVLARRRSETLDFEVARATPEGTSEVTIAVGPNRFRSLGMWMDSGQVAAIREGSPAEGKLELKDKIAEVNGLSVGKDLDPVKLPDYFAELHGQEVKVVVARQVSGGGTKEVTVTLVPEDREGWIERPMLSGDPLSIPSIGAAFHLIPVVLKVEENGPAAKAGIQAQKSSIRTMELVLADGVKSDAYGSDTIKIEFGESKQQNNWAYAFWNMQETPQRNVRLTVSQEGKEQVLTLVPQPAEDWYLPIRGIRTEPRIAQQQASGVADAMTMGVVHTRNSILDIYLTLRNLLSRHLSYEELHGPIGIAMVAFAVAQQSMADLLLFLGFLSVNLAVLNFLPIPVLDGGHMVFLTWEAVTRKRPSERVLVAATYLGLAFVLGLMLLVLYLDLFVHKLSVN